MSKNKGDESAFPYPAVMCNESAEVQGWPGSDGMTLREWYAGMAMQAIVGTYDAEVSSYHKTCAEQAFEIADAMIAQSQKGR